MWWWYLHPFVSRKYLFYFIIISDDIISDHFGGPLAENPNFKKVRNTISDYFGGPLAENSDFKKV